MRKVDIDFKMVQVLASYGCADHEIAAELGIGERTLQRRAREALNKGRSTLRQKLRAAQLRLALEGNPTMLIWLGKQYLGQRDMPLPSDNEEGAIVEYVQRVIVSDAKRDSSSESGDQ